MRLSSTGQTDGENRKLRAQLQQDFRANQFLFTCYPLPAFGLPQTSNIINEGLFTLVGKRIMRKQSWPQTTTQAAGNDLKFVSKRNGVRPGMKQLPGRLAPMRAQFEQNPLLIMTKRPGGGVWGQARNRLGLRRNEYFFNFYIKLFKLPLTIWIKFLIITSQMRGSRRFFLP